MGRHEVKKPLAYCFAVVFVLLGWELTSLVLSSPALPGPLSTIKVFIENLPSLLPDLLISSRRVLASLLIGSVPAILLALAFARNKTVDALFAPVLYLMYPIPKVVILPVLLVLLGLADAPKIALISLTVFFQVIIAVRDGVKSVPDEYVSAMRAYGGGSFSLLRHVLLPAAAPNILTSLRLSVGTSIAVLFLAEAIAGSTGLGYYIMESWAMVDYTRMFSGIICMAALGILIYAAIDVVERRLTRWR